MSSTAPTFEPYVDRSFDLVNRVDYYLVHTPAWQIGKDLAEFEEMRGKPCRSAFLVVLLS
jgi:hypothetical protein